MKKEYFSLSTILILGIFIVGGGAGYLYLKNLEERSDQQVSSGLGIVGSENENSNESKKKSPQGLENEVSRQECGVNVLSPNGKATYSIDSPMNIEFTICGDLLKDFSDTDVVQIYLIKDDGTVMGAFNPIYVKDRKPILEFMAKKHPDDYRYRNPEQYNGSFTELIGGKNYFIRKPTETYLNAGLEDRARSGLLKVPGQFKIMVLARKTFEGAYPGEHIFENISNIEDNENYLASDFSDGVFSLVK